MPCLHFIFQTIPFIENMPRTALQKVLAHSRASQNTHLDLGNLGLDGTELELADLQHFTWL